MGQHMPRRATHAAVRLAGRLLGEDCRQPTMWISESQLAAGRRMLHQMDEFDVVGSEEEDREIAAMAVADPHVWLEVAERGDLDGTTFIPHVLWHHGLGGFQPGETWIQDLMSMIASMPQERRDEEATTHPEYVGFHRVVTEMPDGAGRLMAVMDRWAA